MLKIGDAEKDLAGNLNWIEEEVGVKTVRGGGVKF